MAGNAGLLVAIDNKGRVVVVDDCELADPAVIGMSAIAGLLEPVGRSESGGLMVRMAPPAQSPIVLQAPIGPGLVTSVGIKDWRRLSNGVPIVSGIPSGTIALDGANGGRNVE